ncbi:hypothetical protein SEVIR_3G060466v4 [Setaria viridis]
MQLPVRPCSAAAHDAPKLETPIRSPPRRNTLSSPIPPTLHQAGAEKSILYTATSAILCTLGPSKKTTTRKSSPRDSTRELDQNGKLSGMSTMSTSINLGFG